MYYTTLKQLRENGACSDRYDYLVEHGKIESDDTKVTLKKILKVNGLDDAIWALRAVEHNEIERDARLFACACARRVVERYPEHKDVLLATIKVSERYAIGKATEEELESAERSAVRLAARSDELSAAWLVARSEARSTAWSSARSTAWLSAWSTARSSAGSSEGSSAWLSAWLAERKQQEKIFIKYFCK